jgi:hypothetical protein
MPKREGEGLRGYGHGEIGGCGETLYAPNEPRTVESRAVVEGSERMCPERRW